MVLSSVRLRIGSMRALVKSGGRALFLNLSDIREGGLLLDRLYFDVT